jgi:enoyl-CoA hydratase
MSAELIRYERRDSLAVLTLNRPDKLNAINKEMIDQLGARLDAAEADAAVRVIVLAGTGRAFSAGFDLDMEVAPVDGNSGNSGNSGKPDPEAVRRALHNDFQIIMRFWDCPKVTLAAAHGYCLGSAMELALACDLTIASEECLFGAPEVRFGSGIVAMLLPWLAGPKRAKYLLLSGDDRVSAADALAMGLINRMVPSGRALEDTLEIARRIAANDLQAVKLTKQAINRSLDIAGMRQALLQALELNVIIETSETAESREFNAILKRDGAKAAVAWRSARAAGPTPGKSP